MTRINVVPVTELHNKHLLAEYRELPRLYALAEKWHERDGWIGNLPQHYTLGKGHVRFFYVHLGFIIKRHQQLIDECIARGFNVTMTSTRQCNEFELYMCYDYEPTAEALRINRERIAERLATMRV